MKLYFMVLDDGETFSPLEGCKIVSIEDPGFPVEDWELDLERECKTELTFGGHFPLVAEETENAD